MVSFKNRKSLINSLNTTKTLTLMLKRFKLILMKKKTLTLPKFRSTRKNINLKSLIITIKRKLLIRQRNRPVFWRN